ncbi:MAG: hypothetical protein M1829_000733 [Trizodia sp. TS-e1964]|nr:MAG: hypothetical protein M1829_000733 [Trizodia sp. TS-e1964]
MLSLSAFVAGLAFLASAYAQDALSFPTYVQPNAVPTGVPIRGDYRGALRPQIHFSPPQHFMNDPNGMFVDANDNPTDIVAGNQHWGHATSKDLYHWDNQPIAIYPDKPGDGIFSGSAVIDVDNTSGFFPNQNNGVVAIYTLNTASEETQEIAYSKDGGYTFTKYQQNPVLRVGSTQFRDPKVIWHAPSRKWVMVVAFAQEYAIGIFTSQDLKSWEHASNFTHHGLLGQQYECPNMVEIPMKGSGDMMYVLTISINPGAPLGGSITQYFPGYFDGTTFTPVDSAARIADFGKDNYAGQFFYGTPAGASPVSMAWVSNWQYAQIVPTGPLENWRSSMSLPKVNSLANVTRIGYDLVSTPYNLEPLFDSPLAANASIGSGSVMVDYSCLDSGAIYFQANFSGIPSVNTTGTANFTFFSSVSGESVRGGFYFGGDLPFWIDRGGIRGFDNPFFTDKFSTNNLLTNGEWMLEGVIDRTILEVFLDGGERSATTTFFPEHKLDTMLFQTGGLNEGVSASIAVWGLKSAWAAQAGSDGIVAEEAYSSSSDNPRRHFEMDHCPYLATGAFRPHRYLSSILEFETAKLRWVSMGAITLERPMRLTLPPTLAPLNRTHPLPKLPLTLKDTSTFPFTELISPHIQGQLLAKVTSSPSAARATGLVRNE